jgi:methyl-accepting chemotaxis protein
VLSASGRRQRLSRKIILNLIALLSYPVAIFTTLILLSNGGAMDLRGSSLGLVQLILVSLASSLLVGILISRSITRPLKEASVTAEGISQGDLDSYLAIMSMDEVGSLSASLNAMSIRPRDMVTTIQQSTGQRRLS